MEEKQPVFANTRSSFGSFFKQFQQLLSKQPVENKVINQLQAKLAEKNHPTTNGIGKRYFKQYTQAKNAYSYKMRIISAGMGDKVSNLDLYKKILFNFYIAYLSGYQSALTISENQKTHLVSIINEIIDEIGFNTLKNSLDRIQTIMSAARCFSQVAIIGKRNEFNTNIHAIEFASSPRSFSD